MENNFFNNKKKFINWQNDFIWKKTNLGLTNKNYLLDGKYLLRLAPEKKNPFIQRANEIILINLLTGRGINVPLLAYFKNAKNRFIYVTEFQKNSVNFASKEINKTNLKKVAEIIKKFQTIDYSGTTLKKINMHENLQFHIDQTTTFLDEDMKKTNNLMFDFLNNYNFSQLVVATNDLTKENILIDNQEKYYIIDYEYCGLNDKYYDCSVFIASTNLIENPEMLNYWIALFVDLTDKKSVRIFYYFTLYRNLIGHYWAKKMWQTYKTQIYYDLMILKGQQSQKCYTLIQKN